jgi:hypothetical protein
MDLNQNPCPLAAPDLANIDFVWGPRFALALTFAHKRASFATCRRMLTLRDIFASRVCEH